MNNIQMEKRNKNATPSRMEDKDIKLAKRMEAGDPFAREELILTHLQLVKFLANQYFKYCYGVSFDDLYQEGCTGLIEAVDRYDYRRGIRLSTYAQYYIVKHFHDIIRMQPPIPLPEGVYLDLQKYNDHRSIFHKENGREPTQAEMAEMMSLPLHRIKQLHNYSYSYVRLDQKKNSDGTSENGGEPLYNIIPSCSEKRPVESQAMISIRELDLDYLFEDLDIMLTKREEEVLCRRLGMTSSGIPEPFVEIGKATGLSRESVRLAYHNALYKLRYAAKEKGYTFQSFSCK